MRGDLIGGRQGPTGRRVLSWRSLRRYWRSEGPRSSPVFRPGVNEGRAAAKQSPAPVVSRILGVNPGEAIRPSAVSTWGAVRAERGDQSADEPRERTLKRRIDEGARLRIAEDEIEAFDRIEQNSRVIRAVGALDVERGRRSRTARRVHDASTERWVADRCQMHVANAFEDRPRSHRWSPADKRMSSA